MKKFAQKGFTLIELLVVITIIGILATGATAVYSSAQQKARDSIRQNDILALASAIEQSFGDDAYYPATNELYAQLVSNKYMQILPADPKTGQADSATIFGYVYGASKDSNNVAGQLYEVSANFENAGNAASKEVNTFDGGNDAVRWEKGVGQDTVDTATDTSAPTGTNTYGDRDGDGTDEAGDATAIDDVTSAS
ncbi:prepilin-type N-terminal cleavage/methylation domain-containing protein [Candidatus Peregrinibacteria bacterium]|nr:MAG: prepilin-type N-terminal cleavage/methylation domain-containing protein [Candidatus Peregrinibacteria bacterium]